MVQLNNLRNLLEPLLELRDLLKVVTELDHWRRAEEPVLVNDELTVLERVDVGFDKEEIGTRFNGQEARARNVNSVRVLEVLNCSTGGSLELYN